MKIPRPKSKSTEREPEDGVLDLHPNFDFNKPNKGTFVYHEPSTDVGPIHIPDSKLFPPRWKYYDFDLDIIREEVAKEISFARNLEPTVFKEKEEFFNLLVEHNRRQETRPGVGKYDPKDPHANAIEVDFSKAKGRIEFVDPEFLKDRDIEGDVLILSP